MNTQFPANYGQQPAPGYGPPGPMGGPAPPAPGQQGMYNGYGQQGNAPPGESRIKLNLLYCPLVLVRALVVQ